MQRTSILLPEQLKLDAERAARSKGLSLAGLIRLQLQHVVNESSKKDKRDPLFDDFTTYRGKVANDMSENHDHYLYDDPA